MKNLPVSGLALTALLLCATDPSMAAPAPPANCQLPVERVFQRLDFDVSSEARVTRSVEIPANTEVLIEADESTTDSRLDVRVAGAEVMSSDGPVERWVPHRVVVAKGPARQAEISVIRMEQMRGKVDVRLSRITAQDDPRCAQFWRAMASGDAAYARAEMIFRNEIQAPAGSSDRAYEAALTAYARALRILGPGGLDEAQTRLVYAVALSNGADKYAEGAAAALQAQASFQALGQEFGRDLAGFYWAKAQANIASVTKDEAEANRLFEAVRKKYVDLAASHQGRGERYNHALNLAQAAYISVKMERYNEAIAGYQSAIEAYAGQNETSREISSRQNLA
jgi:hypothetical protein